MQGYANGTAAAFMVALGFLLVGALIVSLASRRRAPEVKAFALTFSVCVFAGGLAQVYSYFIVGGPQDFSDAIYFISLISGHPPFPAASQIPLDDVFAVVIWQTVFRLTWHLGLKFLPYPAVMLNALIMGFTASLTVSAGRRLLGEKSWRLRRVTSLFALNGLFILFGALLLRDCFVTFLNTFVLWAVIRWLTKPSRLNFVVLTVVTGVSTYAMLFLRSQAVVMFGLYLLLAFAFWFLQKRLDNVRVMAAVVAVMGLLVGGPYLLTYLHRLREIQAIGSRAYTELSIQESGSNSLGMRFVVNQPVPVRLILGSGAFLISPIPLWANFRVGLSSYSWIRGYHGFYQVLVLPLVWLGILEAMRMCRRNRGRAMPRLFLVFYMLLNLASVVLSSGEQRHAAQLIPAGIILAALPDTAERKTRHSLLLVSCFWAAAVILVHFVWAVMKRVT